MHLPNCSFPNFDFKCNRYRYLKAVQQDFPVVIPLVVPLLDEELGQGEFRHIDVHLFKMAFTIMGAGVFKCMSKVLVGI